MSSIFTLLLWFALTTYTCGIFYLKIPITMHPNENKEVAVNDTVIISCNVSSIQNLSLFINNTLVNSKNAAIIKYKFTSDKPNVYSFKCTSLKMEYFVKITFRNLRMDVKCSFVVTTVFVNLSAYYFISMLLMYR